MTVVGPFVGKESINALGVLEHVIATCVRSALIGHREWLVSMRVLQTTDQILEVDGDPLAIEAEH